MLPGDERARQREAGGCARRNPLPLGSKVTAHQKESLSWGIHFFHDQCRGNLAVKPFLASARFGKRRLRAQVINRVILFVKSLQLGALPIISLAARLCDDRHIPVESQQTSVLGRKRPLIKTGLIHLPLENRSEEHTS